MALYSMVRYKYGMGGRYTAFCLTPSLKSALKRVINGKELVYHDEGKASSRAVHFQKPETAREWARNEGHRIKGWNGDALPGTRLWP